MYEDFQIIANNIKTLRIRKGYTQEQLAEAAGISASHLSKVETGQKRIGMKTYLSVLQILDVKDDEYVSLAVENEKKEEEWSRFKDLMEDCTDAEERFLLETLENVKQNLRTLQSDENPVGV